jgi:amino acid transporter
MRDPRRDLPRAILLSGALITAVYVAGTAAVLVAIPAKDASGLDGITKALASACARAGWPPLEGLGAVLLTLSGVGVTGAWLAAAARLPFVGGLDRFLPPVFGRIDPRWGTPAVALLVQAGLSIVFVLMSQAGTGVKGAYDALVAMSVIAYFVPFLFLFAAAIRLGREPAPPGSFRVPGGRPVSIGLACIGFATTAVALALAFVPPEGEGDRLFAFGKLVVLTILLFAGALALWIAAKNRHDRAVRAR